jgi:hypothetical protein
MNTHAKGKMSRNLLAREGEPGQRLDEVAVNKKTLVLGLMALTA